MENSTPNSFYIFLSNNEQEDLEMILTTLTMIGIMLAVTLVMFITIVLIIFGYYGGMLAGIVLTAYLLYKLIMKLFPNVKEAK